MVLMASASVISSDFTHEFIFDPSETSVCLFSSFLACTAPSTSSSATLLPNLLQLSHQPNFPVETLLHTHTSLHLPLIPPASGALTKFSAKLNANLHHSSHRSNINRILFTFPLPLVPAFGSIDKTSQIVRYILLGLLHLYSYDMHTHAG